MNNVLLYMGLGMAMVGAVPRKEDEEHIPEGSERTTRPYVMGSMILRAATTPELPPLPIDWLRVAYNL